MDDTVLNKDQNVIIRDKTDVTTVLKCAKQYLKNVGIRESIRNVPVNYLSNCSLFIVFLIYYVVRS